jgi:hypothetical protein
VILDIRPPRYPPAHGHIDILFIMRAGTDDRAVEALHDPLREDLLLRQLRIVEAGVVPAMGALGEPIMLVLLVELG